MESCTITSEQRRRKHWKEADAAQIVESGRNVVKTFNCPYLNAEVELTAERERHISERHPDLLPDYNAALAETLLEPDAVRQSPRAMGARMFSRWYNEIRGGKHVVIVVMTGAGTPARNWIMTAYLARRLVEGVTEWKKD